MPHWVAKEKIGTLLLASEMPVPIPRSRTVDVERETSPLRTSSSERERECARERTTRQFAQRDTSPREEMRVYAQGKQKTADESLCRKSLSKIAFTVWDSGLGCCTGF